MRILLISLTGAIGLIGLGLIAWNAQGGSSSYSMLNRYQSKLVGEFNGERALHDVKYQVSLGARTPGSQAHRQTADWIAGQLTDSNWQTEFQNMVYQSQPIRNVIARWGEGRPWIILGAHYDTRLQADRDPDPMSRDRPVPGANDGASGVAVLLEIARNLPVRMRTDEGCIRQVGLVFFDAEDQGGILGWEWILGSRAFVSSMTVYPDAAVIVDMVGDANLNLLHEQYSDPELAAQIWSVAIKAGFPGFRSQNAQFILDDHIPFLEAGIPAVDIIDFDYPYWHTTQDTPDKVSAESLFQVGEAILRWLSVCGTN